MPPGFLEQWRDEKFSPSEEFDVEGYETQQAERLQDLIIIADVALHTPRRIPNATPGQLGRDKKLCKKVRNRATSILVQWGWELADVEEFRQRLAPEQQANYTALGQQVDWSKDLPAYYDYLRNELRQLAANATITAFRQECNRFGNRILNELTQINQVWEEIYGD